MQDPGLFWTVVTAAAVVGGVAACALAGPPGWMAGGLLATGTYFTAGAAIGGFLGAGLVSGLGFGAPGRGGDGKTDVGGAERAEFRLLSIRRCDGRRGLEFCLEKTPADPVVLVKMDQRQFGRNLAQAVEAVHRRAGIDGSQSALAVRFESGVTLALQDAILEEFRTQGARIGVTAE